MRVDDSLMNIVKSYTGGQMEIQNPSEKYLYRGEIKSIDVVKTDLVVKFSWLAKGVGYPPIPQNWVKDNRLDYSACLEIYQQVELNDKRFCMNSPITNEIVILFPKEGSRLDPAKVAGLEKKIK